MALLPDDTPEYPNSQSFLHLVLQSRSYIVLSSDTATVDDTVSMLCIFSVKRSSMFNTRNAIVLSNSKQVFLKYQFI